MINFRRCRNFDRTLLIGFVISTALSHSNSTVANEILQTSIGARAAAMAQVIAPSVTDSSAIWYNPAGLANPASATLDATIDIGNAPSSNSELRSVRKIEPKFLAVAAKPTAFSDFASGDWLHRLSIGAGYFQPYRLTAFVNDPRNLLADTPIGDITIDYRQLSLAVAYRLPWDISLGLSADRLFLSTKCVDNAVCDEDTAGSSSFTFGATSFPLDLGRSTLNFSFTYRARAIFDANATPLSAVLTKVNRFQLSRPNQYSIGAQMLFPVFERAVADINLMFEYYDWKTANQSLAVDEFVNRYLRAGMSGELHFAFSSQTQVAFRGGSNITRAFAASGLTSPNLGAGAGISFRGHHFIDVAAERLRSISLQNSSPAYLATLSYSYQY